VRRVGYSELLEGKRLAGRLRCSKANGALNYGLMPTRRR
jgi:hypothetical protein